MQVLIIYYSKTGCTKKLAEEIAKGVLEVDGLNCIVRSTNDVTREEFVASDAIIAGSPCYFGTMAAPLKTIFENFVGSRRNIENKIGAAFATSGDPSGGKETTLLSILHAMLIYGMIVVGDPLDATGHYGVACVGEPDRTASENAVKLGKRVAELVMKFKG